MHEAGVALNVDPVIIVVGIAAEDASYFIGDYGEGLFLHSVEIILATYFPRCCFASHNVLQILCKLCMVGEVTVTAATLVEGLLDGVNRVGHCGAPNLNRA